MNKFLIMIAMVSASASALENAVITSVKTGYDEGARGFGYGANNSSQGSMTPHVFMADSCRFKIVSIRLQNANRHSSIFVQSRSVKIKNHDNTFSYCQFPHDEKLYPSFDEAHFFDVYYKGKLAIKRAMVGGAAFRYRDFDIGIDEPATQDFKNALKRGGSILVQIDIYRGQRQ